jgi:SM-20-related protein
MSNWLDDFEKKGWAEINDFIELEIALGIRSEITHLQNMQALKQASIGKQDQKTIDTTQRGDFISWIDSNEAPPNTLSYLRKTNQIREDLNRNFFLGIRDYECHYALYPPGTFYKKHVDRHKNGSPRRVSTVLYLNPDWTDDHGGQLVIYNSDDTTDIIQPEIGKLVLFLSELEHEVLPTKRQRMSITGWMLNEVIM